MRIISLSALVGVLAGITSTLFLSSLSGITRIRQAEPLLIWFLPVAGLLIGWLTNRIGRNKNWEGPFVFSSTLLTHLFGGSAGREKTAVQLSTWASDQLAGRLKPAAEERKTLLLAAMGAGFGSAVGAPWAGVVFGMESLGSKLTIKSFFSCLVASFCASLTTKVLGAPHTVYPAPHFISFSLKTILSVGASAVCFGTLAFCFKETLQKLERFLKTSFPTVPKRLFVGGTVLVALYAWEGSYRYVGLGIPLIQESFYQTSPFTDVFFKAFFTALTLASGFKGGEFIPLVFMGTTLGSYLSQWLPVSSNLLGALGFAAVFGAVSRTPWACTLVTIELFGYPLTLYGFITCFLAFRTCKYLGKSAKRHID